MRHRWRVFGQAMSLEQAVHVYIPTPEDTPGPGYDMIVT